MGIALLVLVLVVVAVIVGSFRDEIIEGIKNGLYGFLLLIVLALLLGGLYMGARWLIT